MEEKKETKRPMKDYTFWAKEGTLDTQYTVSARDIVEALLKFEQWLDKGEGFKQVKIMTSFGSVVKIKK